VSSHVTVRQAVPASLSLNACRASLATHAPDLKPGQILLFHVKHDAERHSPDHLKVQNLAVWLQSRFLKSQHVPEYGYIKSDTNPDISSFLKLGYRGVWLTAAG